MSDKMTMKYLGDSLMDINGETVDIEDVARNIVHSQDGDTIDQIIRENSDHTCEYHGADVWVVDFDNTCDDEEVAVYLSEVLSDLNEHSLMEIVEDFFTVVTA